MNQKLIGTAISIFGLVMLFLFLGIKQIPTKTLINPPKSIQKTASNQILIKNYMFYPETITVKSGTSVTWMNTDIAKHTITSDSPSDAAPSSQLFGKGSSYSFTFTKPGTYLYHCDPHPYMQAKIIVTQ